MKNVQVNYSINGQNYTAVGNTADAAYRKIVDRNNRPIHEAGGRLTKAQLISRASRNGILIETINEKGIVTYNHMDETKSDPKPEKRPSQKFMYARFTSNCKETGNHIKS